MADPPERLWIDAQLPPALARWLTRECRMAAVHVADLGLLMADDQAIFDAARIRGVSAFVTKDADFLKLLEQHGPPPQVVWITCGNVTNAALRGMVRAQWSRVAALLAAGEPLVEMG